ncbi:MAG TPA: C25 family peptidase propeptide domain-containing protein [Acidobacteriota bacterium]|nr:C25 family peptidase propeptide domain-containing protein [Acidobacteriota bacterium]
MPRRLLLAAFLSTAMIAAHSAAANAVAAEARRPHGARVIAEDLRGVTLEYAAAEARWDTVAVAGASYERVRVPGAFVLEAPGRPALPTDLVSLAVPDGMAARVRVEAEEAIDRPGLPPLPVAFERIVSDDPRTGPASEYRFEPEGAVYRGVSAYPGTAAAIGAGQRSGELWVVPLRIAPVRWNPATRAYRVLRRLTLRVDFEPASDRERLLRRTARPGSDSKTSRRIQERMLVNGASARSFPRRAREWPRLAPARRLLDGNPEFRISVTQTGWTSVSFAALQARGFPSGVALPKIGLWERGYDDAGDSATATPIPVAAREASPNGVFDAGDEITFYARSWRDRVGPASIENRYTDANVYWLTWTAADAAVPDTITGVIPTGAFTAPAWFPERLHLEEEGFVQTSPDQTTGSPKENIPYMFWTNGGSPDFPESFATPIPFADPEPTQPFRIRARYQGLIGSFHRLNIFYESSTGQRDTLALGDVSLDQEVYLLDTGFTLPGSRIGPGTNQYVFTGDQKLSSAPPNFPSPSTLNDVRRQRPSPSR